MKRSIRLSLLTALLTTTLLAALTACTDTTADPTDTGDTGSSTVESTTESETAGGLVLVTQAPADTTPDSDPSPTDTTAGDTSAVTDPTTGTTPSAPTDSGAATVPSAPVTDPSVPPETQPEPVDQPVVFTFDGVNISYTVDNILDYIKVDGSSLVIIRPGIYELRGNLNGQIRVSVDKTADVELILNNFTAACSFSAPLYIESANEATIVLADGSVNTLTDAASYALAPGEIKPAANACLYSSDDMVIKGNGSLTVTGNYNNGIGCKNDLRIKSGNITVTAKNNILKGNDSVEIEAATLHLSGGEDAIKTDNLERADKGYILITAGANITIDCSKDALQADTLITVEAGAVITGSCGKYATNCPGSVNVDADAMKVVAGMV